MRRRGFIVLAAAWPLTARGAEPERVRRVGVLHDYPKGDPEGEAQIAAFRDELRKLGWAEGGNVRIDYRTVAADTDTVRKYAAEVVADHPDVILASGATVVATLQRATRSVPIVFANATDPVGSGLVDSLARPGRNATGFTQFEFGISAKWLELLKEIAPGTVRVAVIRDPTARSGGGQLGAIQAMAPSLGVELRPIDPTDSEAIGRGLAALAGEPSGGLVVTTSRLARAHREQIIALAARYRLPAIYPFRVYVAGGGLAFYGPDAMDPYRRAAGYVDRILKGEKPGDLPVQAPTRYELVLNLKTAAALGLKLPQSLVTRAELIE